MNKEEQQEEAPDFGLPSTRAVRQGEDSMLEGESNDQYSPY